MFLIGEFKDEIINEEDLEHFINLRSFQSVTAQEIVQREAHHYFQMLNIFLYH